MAGFSSQDNFISNISSTGNFWRTDWNKNTFGTTAHTAGTWYLLSQTGGNPAASSHLGTGTNLLYQPCYDLDSTSAGIQHNGFVAAAGDVLGHRRDDALLLAPRLQRDCALGEVLEQHRVVAAGLARPALPLRPRRRPNPYGSLGTIRRRSDRSRTPGCIGVSPSIESTRG